MKKRIIPFIVLVVFAGLMACNQAPVADTAKGDKNKAVVAAHIDAIAKGDLATFESTLADNFKGLGPALTDSTDKATALANWKARLDTVYSAITYTRYEAQAINIADGINKGDWALEWGLVKVDYKDGSPSASFSYHGAFRLENEKIVFSVAYYNVADIMKQRGYTFVPPKKQDNAK